MNCNVKITAVGTADGLEVSIHGGSVGMMTAAELIVARVLMAVADDEENLAGLKDSMFEIINEMVKDCWAEKTAKTEAEKEAAVNQLKAFVAMLFEPEELTQGGSNGGRNENKTRCQKYRQKGGGV